MIHILPLLSGLFDGQSTRMMFNDTFLVSDQAVFPFSIICNLEGGERGGTLILTFCIIKS